jgi:hypothetical protein
MWLRLLRQSGVLKKCHLACGLIAHVRSTGGRVGIAVYLSGFGAAQKIVHGFTKAFLTASPSTFTPRSIGLEASGWGAHRWRSFYRHHVAGGRYGIEIYLHRVLMALG